MRLLIAALVVTLTVAIAASVVATWASVADAPWEDEPVIIDRTAEIRCQGALDYRNTLTATGPRTSSGPVFYPPGYVSLYETQLEDADREIDRYC